MISIVLIDYLYRSYLDQYNLESTFEPIRRSNINNDIRMVLIGTTGAGKKRTAYVFNKTVIILQNLGKSSFGNTILGEKKFQARTSCRSVTIQCQMGERYYKNQRLVVLDTPGFFHTYVSQEEFVNEITKSYQILAPGPHAFLIVHSIVNRYTAESDSVVQCISKIFGKEVFNYCLFVFTGRDLLDGEKITVKEFVEELDPDSPLKMTLDRFQGRYIAVNNRGSNAEKEETLDELLRIIRNMMSRSNGNDYYSSRELETLQLE